jgi:Domain of unknown function (DUF4105)
MRPEKPANRAWLVCALAVIAAAGCRGVVDSSQWSPNQAVLSTADIDGNQVKIHNIRNTEYRTSEDYTVRHYDKTFDLEKLDSVDYIIVPFPEVPGGAHTFLSFGFNGEEYVAISVEVRRKKGEEFDPVKALVKEPEIMYVVGDERDLIQLRTIHWLSDVYMYRAQAPKAQMQALFVSMLKHANRLSEKPEHYNLITNNCTTNIMEHINEVSPHKVPYTYQVLFPAYSDQLAYRLKLIKIDDNFERTKQEARINEPVYVYRDSPDFSIKIRAGHPLLTKKSWEVDGTTLR